ncbi:MAG: hypothetical protein R2932_59210 [Caldilineaceae bacterium]
MFSLPFYPPIIFRMMSEINTGGGGTVSGNADAGHDFAGRDSQRYDSNVHINFDRSANWDKEREELTPLQRIRDLENYVFGDRRGLTMGLIRQLRNHVVWLIILSLLQFIALVLLVILIGVILRGGA